MKRNSLVFNKLWLVMASMALALSMSIFTGCRSYEDDICSLQERMDKLQSELQALQGKVVKEVPSLRMVSLLSSLRMELKRKLMQVTSSS